MSDCLKCSRLLSDYMDQQCDEGQRSFVEEHLAACPDCAERLTQLLLLQEVAADAAVDVPEGFTKEVMRRIREPERRRFPPMRFTMAAAAAVALLFIWQLNSGKLPLLMKGAGSAAPADTSVAMSMADMAGDAGDQTYFAAPQEGTPESAATGGAGESSDGDTGTNGSEKGMMHIEGMIGSNMVRSFTTNPLLAGAPQTADEEDDAYLPVLEASNNGLYAFVLLVDGSTLTAEQKAALFDGIPRFNEEGDTAALYYLVSIDSLETLELRLTELGLTPDDLAAETVSQDSPLLDELAPYGAIVVH